MRPTLAAMIVLMALAGNAGGACDRPCKTDTARCIAERCADVHGAARRSCREICRGIGGCANIRTLAWVDTVCRTDATGSSVRQALKIRRGNCAPVTVMELPAGPQLPDVVPGGACKLYGEYAAGTMSVLAAPFQRLIVSGDARSVVFEVTDDPAITLLPSLQPVPPEMDGLWYVRSDGTGLRRLGPASRYPRWLAYPDPDGPLVVAGLRLQVFANSEAAFGPSSRQLAYSDLGPGPTGEDAPQVWVVDLESGERRQITRLPKPALAAGTAGAASLLLSEWIDDETIVFFNMVSPPDRRLAPFTVKTDGSEPEAIDLPDAFGGRIDANFAVIGRRYARAVLPHPDGSADLFLLRSDGNVIQLTNLHSRDLRNQDPSPNGRRILFIAPDDPLGTNPSRNCQLFSVNDFGGDLRQLTAFAETDHATSGCNFTLPRSGCSISTTFWDHVTSEIVTYSNCDPFGSNPRGGQVFAMRPDGSRLRQLTATRGLTIDADGAVTAHLPGPFRYASKRGN